MRCFICGEQQIPDDAQMSTDVDLAIQHLRLMHPEEYEPIQRWSDGGPVIEDDTLSPEDFTRGGES
jgi:hypothetical protein